MISLSVNSAGFHLNYFIEGEGYPVFVIGSSTYYQRTFSENIKKHFQFIFADHRGFVSPPSRELGNDAFTLDVLVEDIELVRKQIGIAKMIILGHSGHAFMALAYAKKYPGRISGVVMIAVTPDYSHQTHHVAAEFFEREASSERKELFAANMSKLADAIAAAPEKRFLTFCLAAGPKSWYNYNYDASSLWEGVYTNMQMIDYVWGEVFRDIDITIGLENFDIPVLVVLGKYDFLTGPTYLWDETATHFINIHLKIFEKSAHSPHQEEASVFDELMIRWFHTACVWKT